MGHPWGYLCVVCDASGVFVGLMDAYADVDKNDLARLIRSNQFVQVSSLESACAWVSNIQQTEPSEINPADGIEFLSVVDISERGTKWVVGHNNLYRIRDDTLFFVPNNFDVELILDGCLHTVIRSSQLPINLEYDVG